MCLWIGSGKPMGASAGASPRVVVRPAQPQDQAAIAAFNQAMALETENRPLDLATVQAGVAQLMARPELGFYVVAEVAGEPVACLLVTREWSDWRNGLFWWIQSVYVHPHRRRQGLFRSLYHQVEVLARQQGDVCGLRLYVEKDNAPAQATYQALGMAPTPYQVYESTFPDFPAMT
jgi:ribosomal protein S18 acetylase RimI-like enzyme